VASAAPVGSPRPLHSFDAEQAVIGSLLIDSSTLPKVEAIVLPRDFFDHRHELIYAAIRNLEMRASPVDLVTVGEELERLGQSEAVDAPGYLMRLMNDTPTATHAESYAEIVRRRSVQRELVEVAGKIASIAYEEMADADVALDRAEAALAAAALQAEQAARTVRKQGPGLLVKGADRVEQAARTVRKQGPGLLVRSGERVEQWGRAIRKQGPGLLVKGAERAEQAARAVRKRGPSILAHGAGQAEQAARTVRKQGPPVLRKGVKQTEQVVARTRDLGAGIATQTGKAVDRTRAVGDDIAGGTQSLVDRVQKRIQR